LQYYFKQKPCKFGAKLIYHVITLGWNLDGDSAGQEFDAIWEEFS
jgi:hypothetical protein